MTKTMTRMIAAVAAMGLVATPIMAQANTRASDSAVTYNVSNSAPGLGREVEGEGAIQGIAVYFVGFLSFSAIAFGALYASGVIEGDAEDCISPGACNFVPNTNS